MTIEALGEGDRPKGILGRLVDGILNLPPIRRPRAVMRIYNEAGGSLLAEGLAFSALFAGATGVLFCIGFLGYILPSEADRQQVLNGFTGDLAPYAGFVRGGLTTLARNPGTFSIIGLVSLAWGTSHFYGVLDEAIGRIFDHAPARGFIDRILRGLVSDLLLVGGLVSGVAIAAAQRLLTTQLNLKTDGDVARTVSDVGFPLVTAIVIVLVVAVLYRIVPNLKVPIRVLWLPSLIVGLILTALAELLVYLAPLLAGSLYVFGSVAAVFVALAWLHLAFQVLLIGAAWTRIRLDDASPAA